MLDLADRCPVRLACVELAAGAAMHRQHCNSLGFRYSSEFGRIHRLVVPAKPHLQGDRNAYRAYRGPDQLERETKVPHQMRPGITIRDLFCRTAHIDVDHRRAGPLRDPGRLRHAIWVATGDLHDVRIDAGAFGFEPVCRIGPGILIRGDHFGDDERSAEATRQPAHAEIGDAGHRGEESAALQVHPADAEIGLTKSGA